MKRSSIAFVLAAHFLFAGSPTKRMLHTLEKSTKLDADAPVT